MVPKKYKNIVGCQRVEGTNIQTYSDAEELIKQIFGSRKNHEYKYD